MCWYRWKLWRLAWSLNSGGSGIWDGDGMWLPLCGRLWMLVRRKEEFPEP